MDGFGDRPQRDGEDGDGVTPSEVLSCDAVDKLIIDYVRGLLPVAQANLVTDHLLHCDKHRRDQWGWIASVLYSDEE